MLEARTPETLSASRVFLAIAGASCLIAAAIVPYATYIVHKYHGFEVIDSTSGVGVLMGSAGLVFSIIGFCYFLARGRRIDVWTVRDGIPFAASAAVYFFYVWMASEYTIESGDFRSYVNAALRLLRGENPFGDGYLYPPLFVQGLAALHVAVHSLLTTAIDGLSPWAPWLLEVNVPLETRAGVVYFYQVWQITLFLFAYHLTARLAENLGIERHVAYGIAAVLFLVNVPLFRALRYNQASIAVLVALLGFLVYADRRPVVGGILAALGCHIKLIPVIAAPIAVVTGRFRAAISFVAAFVAVAAVQTRLFTDWGLWGGYAAFFGQFPKGHAYRDNGLRAIASSLGRVAPTLADYVGAMTVIGAVAVLCFFGWRALVREINARRQEGNGYRRLVAHTSDAIALTLILSPMVWEHHFIFAFPLVILALALGGNRPSRLVPIGAALIYWVPVFDVFAFSDHRLLGLILLLIATHPCLPPRSRAD